MLSKNNGKNTTLTMAQKDDRAKIGLLNVYYWITESNVSTEKILITEPLFLDPNTETNCERKN